MNNIKNEMRGKIWRGVKVLYFLITGFCLLLVSYFILPSQKVYHGAYYNYIINFYLGSLYVLIIVGGYFIITDLIRRIISYIDKGSFDGFIKYSSFNFKKNGRLIILLVIVLGFLINGSNTLKNECKTGNQYFDEKGVCSCITGYDRVDGLCVLSSEQKMINSLPYGVYLREYKEINVNTYLGIYVKNYLVESEPDDINENLYYSCPEQVEGQAIEGIYYLFTYKDGKIISQIPIRDDITKSRFPYKNTKINNYYFFGGLKPQLGNDQNKLEVTDLINLQDYNGDLLKNEFLLINYEDSMCGHNNYMVVGYDENLNLIKYGIKGKDGTISYWSDNFIPNASGEVVNGIECGDHGAGTSFKGIYNYDKINKQYQMIKSETKECPEGTY